MNKVKRLTIAVIFCLAALFASVACAAEKENSVNVGVAGGAASNATATAFLGEYERSLNNNLSLLGRIGTLDYKFDDGTNTEDGNGKGLDVGVRIYPSGGMKGFYFGGAIGWWSTDWTFTDDKGKPYETQGKGSSTSVRLDLEAGGRFKLGKGPVSLMPSFHLGNYFSVSNDCTYTSGAVGSCDKGSGFNIYAYVGLAVGIAF